MPLDALPGKLVVPSRDALVQLFLRSTLIRNPAADTRPGGKVYLDAQVWADAATSILAKAVTISASVSRSTATGTGLDDWAKREGTVRQSAVGAAGAVGLVATAGGSTILSGDLLIHQTTGLRFQVTNTALYPSGAAVPINGVDVGPATNLPAGTILTWVSPRPGVVGGTATVLSQVDGSGLSGGVNAEGDDALRARLDYLASNPPASGNDAQYQSVMSTAPGIAVQQGFTYPAVFGPGTIGVTFTLRPSQPGANRIPTSTQLAQMASYLGGVMPANDSILMCTIVASPVTIVLKVLWAVGAAGWADGATFPLYHPTPNLVSAAATAGGARTPTTFRVTSTAMTEIPQVGQSIAFFDLANLVFRRKQFATVTTISATAYDVTVSPIDGVSDTGYTPLVGQPCCPWSDSLNSLVTSVVAYMDTLGPGEQFASFFDPGLRQHRSPVSPQFWPSSITNRLIGGSSVPVPASGPQQNQPPVPTLLTIPTIQDVVLQEPTVPFPVPIGTPGVSSNVLTLGGLVVFPE